MSDNTINLILHPDNPCNTTITDGEAGPTLYTVVTEHGKDDITYVKNGDGDILASWVWHDVTSDIITIGKLPPVPVSSWLKKSMIPFNDTVSMEDGNGRKLKWKNNCPGGALEVYEKEDKVHPLARFDKSARPWNRKVDPPVQLYKPAQLTIDRRAESAQDLIVISFLQLEKSRRARESSTMHRADVLATPPVQVGTNYVLKNGGT